MDLQDLDLQTIRYLGFDENHVGSLIANTLAEGPAAKAGLRAYDVVTEIDDVKIKNTQDFMDKISDLEPGKKIKIKYLRNNRGQAISKTATITVELRPNEKDLLKAALKKRPRN